VSQPGAPNLLNGTLEIFYSILCLFVCGVKPLGSSYTRFSCCRSRCAVLTLNNGGWRVASLPGRGCTLAFPVEGEGWSPACLSHSKHPPKFPLQQRAGFALLSFRSGGLQGAGDETFDLTSGVG